MDFYWVTNNTAKRFVTVLVLVAICSTSVFVVFPRRAHAGAGIYFDPIDFITEQIPTEIKNWILDGLAFAMVDRIIQEITDEMVDWIRNGFDGNPGFVTDFSGFVSDIAEQEADLFIEGADLEFLCDPFEINIQVALRDNQKVDRRFECTIDQVLQQNFIGGNFVGGGGWDSWLRVTTQVQNYSQGAYLLALDEMYRRTGAEQKVQSKKVGFANGFLNYEKCENVGPPDPNTGETDKQCTTETPGSYVQGQLNRVGTAGIERLTVADEIDELIGAALGLIMNELLTQAGGLGGRP